MWARAFIDDSFKKKIEKNPLEAAEEMFPGRRPIKPLFNSQTSYLPVFTETVNAFAPEVRDKVIKNRFNELTPQQRRALRDSIKGNKFTLLKKDTTKIYPLYSQNIDGPSHPDLPLTRHDWIRIYTKAAVNNDFLRLLEENPVEAVKQFKDVHDLNHNLPNAPIFELPTLDELLAIIPAGDPLKENNAKKLKEILEQIAAGAADCDYEAHLSNG